jgi:TatD DNase family protein
VIDAHCHLQDPRLAADLEGVLARARAAGVSAMVCCGTRESDWDRVVDLARARPEVIPMAGLHPWYAGEAGPGWEARLEAAFDAGCGAGECGLDFSEGRPPAALQEEVLRVQVRLAIRRDLPLALHCVKAADRLEGILRETGLPRAGGLVHAFSGDPATARRFLALGLHLSFGGALTRPGAKRATASFREADADRILLETDSPDLTPSGVEPPNEPANLARVAAAAAALRGEEAPARAFANARALFRRWMA